MKKQLLTLVFVMSLTFPASAIISQLGVLDLTANGGINPATGVAWQQGDTYRLIFVTSTETFADADGFAYYDNYVQTLADNSSITTLSSVSWQALVSSGTTGARDHTGTNPLSDGSSTSIWLMNGTEIVGDNYSDFYTPRPSSEGTARAIDRTESNALVPGNDGNGGWDNWRGTWTGSNGDGTINGTGIDGDNPRVGLANSGWTGNPSISWINRGTGVADGINPSTTYRLYAISSELRVIPEPSSTALLGLGGLALILRRRR